jgi:transcriptional regulator with XRE-family HTH domain
MVVGVNPDESVGRRLIAARQMAGITREELAALIATPKLGYQTIGKIERGERRLERHEAPLFARALDVPVEFFYEDVSDSQLDRIERHLADLLAERETLLAEIDKQNHLLDEQSGLLRRIEALVRVLEGAVIEPGAAEPDVPLPGLPLPSERDAQEQTRPERTPRDPDRRRSNRRRESA